MPLTTTASPRKASCLLLIGLMSALPVVLGIITLHLQAKHALMLSSQQAAENAIRQFDTMLDNANIAAQVLLPKAGQACEAALQLALREEVTRLPFVRSTYLVSRNENYCSSLVGHYSELLNPRDYVGGRLWLRSGNIVTPTTALLVLRVADGDRAALATIDGFHLQNVLRLISQYARLKMQVGPYWLSDNGQVHTAIAPQAPVAAVTLLSQRYPYSVSAGFPAGYIWSYMKAQYPAVFSFFLFFGVLSGIAVHWLLKRSSLLTNELKRALAANEFIPYFQPVVRGVNQQWAGLEVLMRWKHPKEGLVPPGLFVPLAEHSGLIVPMSRSLMKQTAQLLAPHAQHFMDGFHIAFNITASHCRNLELLEDCRAFLAMFAPRKISLVLELTERELIQPSDITLTLFKELRNLGVLMAIDDFGTGHSSLAYLREFNFDYLKIDQSFIAMIGVDALSGHLLDSIIELSDKLELGMIAEGVETLEQQSYLLAKKVDYLQGYLFSRPMPAEEFVRALREY